MRVSRLFIALALLLGLGVAYALPVFASGDNWLIGSWNTRYKGTDITYTFSDDTIQLDSEGNQSTRTASYKVDGNKITVTITPDGMDSYSWVITKLDDTHASRVMSDGTFTLTKQ